MLNYSGEYKDVSTVPSSQRKDISKAKVAPVPDQPYDPYGWHPLVEVTLDGKKLSNATDYRLVYYDNVEVGDARIVIIGRNGYKGQVETTFRIVDSVDINECDMEAIPDQTYTGSPIEPKMKLTYDTQASYGVEEVRGYTATYTNNVNVGTAKVRLDANEDSGFSGSRTAEFKILPANISGVTAKAIPDQTYTGKALTPTPTLTYNGKTLKKDTDYTLSYSKNTDIGTATITVTGKGNFKGTTKVTFEIKKIGATDTLSDLPVKDGNSGTKTITTAPTLRKYSPKSETATSNIWMHGYNVWSSVTGSYLHEHGGVLERVEFVNGDLIVETLSADLKSVKSKRVIDPSTIWPSDIETNGNAGYWGAFYSGERFNFVVTGQENPEESDDVAVFRVSKFKKDWTFVDAAEVKGANTQYPFEAGTCDVAEDGSFLYVRTCHLMYADSNGTNHQASCYLLINTATMGVEEMGMGVGDFDTYVSHSFAQYVTPLDDTWFTIDHGDAYPRAIVVQHPETLYLYPGDNRIRVMGYYGPQGENSTGASIGGFEHSTAQGTVLAAGDVTSVLEDHTAPRNVWVAVVRSDLEGGALRYLTPYDGSSEIWAETPFLVKVDEDCFLVMWDTVQKTEEGQGYYWDSDYTYTGDVCLQFIDGNGDALSDTFTVKAELSNCQPIVYDGKVVWYVGDEAAPVYYVLDLSGASDPSGETTTYTVTFDSAGGSKVASQKVESGKKATKPANPTRDGYTFVSWQLNSKDYDFGSKVTKNITLTATWKKGGGGSEPATVPMYRLYNPYSGEHFYTGDAAERRNVIKAGWNDEQIGWYAPASDKSVPVYRVYNRYGGEHHYTTDKKERDMLVKAGWDDEGIGWYSDPKETVPLLREYNPNQFACNHNYTTDKKEHDYLVSLGWHDEGYAWYAVKAGK